MVTKSTLSRIIKEDARYARICSKKSDFKTTNQCLTSELEKQDFNKQRLKKSVTKFYRSHFDGNYTEVWCNNEGT